MNVAQFITKLASVSSNHEIANPYNCYSSGIDASKLADKQRQQHLSHYLSYRQNSARFILIAEAPGYQGARFTGLAMTSERLILEKKVSEVDIFGHSGIFSRTSDNKTSNKKVSVAGYNEPTATIVWDIIKSKGKSREIVLWNTFPFHPHKPGKALSNRKPKVKEINQESWALQSVLSMFNPSCKIIAIGRVAQEHLRRLGICASSVTHPANGGATKFRNEIQKLI